MLRACKQAFLFLALLSTRLHMSPAMTCLLLFRSSHIVYFQTPLCAIAHPEKLRASLEAISPLFVTWMPFLRRSHFNGGFLAR